jgi:hypothetical protein
MEDKVRRDQLKEQAKRKKSPFEYIDMSAKKAWKEDEWQKRCRTKIKRSDAVIALISKKTYHASGARWEMKCAQEEGKPVLGIQVKWNNPGAKPPELGNNPLVKWSWANISEFLKAIENEKA